MEKKSINSGASGLRFLGNALAIVGGFILMISIVVGFSMAATGEADWVLFVAPGIWSIVAIILRYPFIALATIAEAAARYLEESGEKRES